jgi:carbamoyltransferase
MIILGIQKHSHSSACLIEDGEIVYFNIEERLSKIKRDNGIPIYCLNEILKFDKVIDKIVITGYNYNHEENKSIAKFVEKLGIKLKDPDNSWFSFYHPHHLSHAFGAYYNSGFKDALIFVCDGKGSQYFLSNNIRANETTSAYFFSNSNVNLIYKKLHTGSDVSMRSYNQIDPGDIIFGQNEKTRFIINDSIDVGYMYSCLSESLGFNREEEGKLMGLQSYGKYNSLFDDFVNKDMTINMDYIKDDGNYKIDIKKHPILKQEQNIIDFAYCGQKALEYINFKTIQDLLEITKAKNLILTGGVALNVIANYNFRKMLPKDVKLYVEPICGDEGNSLGAAIGYYKIINPTKNIEPLKTNYLNGFIPSYDFKLNSDETIIEVEPKHIVELILKQNIVAIFQGKSESGPRALGNRSILFDPRNPNGKHIVNTVKNREAFRPFACSILKDEADKWFDMAGLEESPYMMYAMQAREGVKDVIPSVVHVDNTCRIQTVKETDNKILFELLTEFYKQTGVPALFNTSFNLAGKVICETIEDALWTLRNSKIEYLYLPDTGKLVTIKNLPQ